MNDEGLAAIAGLQERVDKLRSEVASERQTRTWQAVAVVALIVFGAVANGLLLLKVSAQADELSGNRVADCERTNAARAAILQVTDAIPEAIISALVAATDEGRTPEEQVRVDRITAEAVRVAAERTQPQRAALAPRDCTLEAVDR